MDLFNRPYLQRLTQSVDVSAFRQKVIANNIANVDTPHFKRSSVQFEQLLREKMNSTKLNGTQTDIQHMSIGSASLSQSIQPRIATDHNTAMNNNHNNVDIDVEMAELAKNQMKYSLLVQQLGHEISMMRKAIGGGT